MRAVDIIIKKRDGEELTRAEIEFFVNGFTKNEIPDYQVSAWAMAIMLNGMSDQETTDLTLAIANSGDKLDLSSIVPLAVDKHSTGGVGDKTSLVVAPLVASCDLPVAKMSGRGLGFSGGTLDKLESIPGYRVDLSTAEFMKQLKEVGIVLTGQSLDLAPADGKLYALRDVTGTVPSIPLIASSVMSKKIAAGAQAIVLDVKIGLGAFMQTLDDARRLARLMVAIGRLSNRKVVSLLSDMNQPLGEAVGNALEMEEALDVLKGRGPADFKEHCLVVASHMLFLGKKADDLPSARILAEKALNSGKALEFLRKLVKAQEGDVAYVDNSDLLPKAKIIEKVNAPRDGYLLAIDARRIGEAAVKMGAGRLKKGDAIDLAVGLMIHRKVGDHVNKGDPLFTIHANNKETLEIAKNEVLAAHQWSESVTEPLPLFYGVIE